MVHLGLHQKDSNPLTTTFATWVGLGIKRIRYVPISSDTNTDIHFYHIQIQKVQNVSDIDMHCISIVDI